MQQQGLASEPLRSMRCTTAPVSVHRISSPPCQVLPPLADGLDEATWSVQRGSVGAGSRDHCSDLGHGRCRHRLG